MFGKLMVSQADAGKSTCVLNTQKSSKYNCLGLLERKRKQSADNSATHETRKRKLAEAEVFAAAGWCLTSAAIACRASGAS